MEFDLSIFEKQKENNEILRAKYEKLANIEKGLHNSPGYRRITQNKIGKAVGISDSMISKWLKNERELSVETILRMAEVLLIEEGLLNLRIENAGK